MQLKKMGGGRAWQEMAKNPALPGKETASANPKGLHKKQIEHKQAKTERRIGAKITEVRRGGKER